MASQTISHKIRIYEFIHACTAIFSMSAALFSSPREVSCEKGSIASASVMLVLVMAQWGAKALFTFCKLYFNLLCMLGSLWLQLVVYLMMLPVHVLLKVLMIWDPQLVANHCGTTHSKPSSLPVAVTPSKLVPPYLSATCKDASTSCEDNCLVTATIQNSEQALAHQAQRYQQEGEQVEQRHQKQLREKDSKIQELLQELAAAEARAQEAQAEIIEHHCTIKNLTTCVEYGHHWKQCTATATSSLHTKEQEVQKLKAELAALRQQLDATQQQQHQARMNALRIRSADINRHWTVRQARRSLGNIPAQCAPLAPGSRSVTPGALTPTGSMQLQLQLQSEMTRKGSRHSRISRSSSSGSSNDFTVIDTSDKHLVKVAKEILARY